MEKNGGGEREMGGWSLQKQNSSASLLYTFYTEPNCNIIVHAIKSKTNLVQNHIISDIF